MWSSAFKSAKCCGGRWTLPQLSALTILTTNLPAQSKCLARLNLLLTPHLRKQRLLNTSSQVKIWLMLLRRWRTSSIRLCLCLMGLSSNLKVERRRAKCGGAPQKLSLVVLIMSS